jgi:hypothetical protein
MVAAGRRRDRALRARIEGARRRHARRAGRRFAVGPRRRGRALCARVPARATGVEPDSGDRTEHAGARLPAMHRHGRTRGPWRRRPIVTSGSPRRRNPPSHAPQATRYAIGGNSHGDERQPSPIHRNAGSVRRFDATARLRARRRRAAARPQSDGVGSSVATVGAASASHADRGRYGARPDRPPCRRRGRTAPRATEARH